MMTDPSLALCRQSPLDDHHPRFMSCSASRPGCPPRAEPPPKKVDLRLALQPLIERVAGGARSLAPTPGTPVSRPQRARAPELNRPPEGIALADEWECRPPTLWFSTPIGARLPVGHLLLANAMQYLAQSSSSSLGYPFQHKDTSDSKQEWAGEEVRVGALNVGLKGLAASCDGVTQLLSTCRCDILFLSDLRATRRNIGTTR